MHLKMQQQNDDCLWEDKYTEYLFLKKEKFKENYKFSKRKEIET